MPFRRIQSKLLKDRAMRRSPLLHSHLPETLPYHPDVLKRMLDRHAVVFVKPDLGSQGRGIVRLKRIKHGGVHISWGLSSRRVNRKYMVRALHQRLRPYQPYLVQQGLQLTKYHHRLMDIRVFLQKPGSKWLISGKVVRVGAAGRFVTNYSQGGRPVHLSKVLDSIYRHDQQRTEAAIQKIDQLAYHAAAALSGKFRGIRVLGIDIALDRTGRIWIIEANTRPGTQLFKQLKDQSMYRTIVARYQRIKYMNRIHRRK
ncbi:YheC/YheD family protein [Paenibacillus sp. YPG26]|uniref:YheC/YheD family protein n=1 Tax=Paenibacillus sp. YPG26 TaxID=2878915 RepID=UPI00203C7385|nr:YheC/YheD family protein [Paenibacillus sp. YPG26]USB34309.1 YheC/YheD family protein [Paenibacillus sp. YPG26]